MQLLLGLEKVDLNSTWFRSSLLIRYWGRMGPATPGIPPFGFKGSPMLLAKAGIKEMTEGKKPNNQQQQKTQLLPCPLPAPPPKSLCIPPQPHQGLIHRKEAPKALIPSATLHPTSSKKGPKAPTSLHHISPVGAPPLRPRALPGTDPRPSQSPPSPRPG